MQLSIPLKDLIYFITLLLAVLVGAMRFKSLSKSTVIIFILIVYTFSSELLAHFLRQTVQNNLIVYHIYNPVQYALMGLAYSTELKQYRLIYLSIILYLSFAIFNGLFLQPAFEEFCSYSFHINAVLVSLLCLFYLYKLLQEETENPFTSYPLFWISVGYLIYNVVNITGLGAFNVLSEDRDLSVVLETIRTLTNDLLYSMFIVAFFSKQQSLNN